MGQPSKAKPDVSIKSATLLRVLAPLLFMLIPVAILVIAGFDFVPEWLAGWFKIAAWILFGVIGLWVAIRLGFFAREVFKLRRQKNLLRKQDPLFIAKVKMHERLESVHEIFKETELGIYDLPYYLVLGHDSREIDAFLKGSGLTTPANLSERFQADQDDFERWHITNEGVFISVPDTRTKKDDQTFEMLLEVLAQDRPNAPINGALILLPINHLTEGESENRTLKESAIQRQLQKMQTVLQLSFPVNLIVSGLDRMSGFYDMFGAMGPDQREQIFGWTNPSAMQLQMNSAELDSGLESLERMIKRQMFRRMETQNQIASLDRIYYFSAEFGALLESIENTVRNVCSPNRFLEPMRFNGVYLVGGLIPELSTAFDLAGPLGTCRPSLFMNKDELEAAGKVWFCKDLLHERLLPEANCINRPAWVIKQQKRVKVAGAIILSILAAAGISKTVDGGIDAWNLKKDLSSVLDESVKILEAVGSEEEIFTNLAHLEGKRRDLASKDAINRLLETYRYKGVKEDLLTIQQAIFSKRYLSGFISKQEKLLQSWEAFDHFDIFKSTFVEYVRWANPKGANEDRSIEPFANYQNIEKARCDQLVANYGILDNGSSVVDTGNARGLIRRTFAKITDQCRGNSREQLWWSELNEYLRQMSLGPLLDNPSPAVDAPYEQLHKSIDDLQIMLANFKRNVDGIHTLLNRMKDSKIDWTMVDAFFADVSEAAQGWPSDDWKEVEEVIATARKEANASHRDNVSPIHDQIHRAKMFYGHKDFPSLGEALRSTGKNAGVEMEADSEDKSFEIASNVLDLMVALNGYMTFIDDQEMEKRCWQNGRTSNLETLRLCLHELKSEARQAAEWKQRAQDSMDILVSIAKPLGEAAADGPAIPKIKGKAGKVAQLGAKELSKDKGKEKLRLTLKQYRWDDLSQWAPKWIESLDREWKQTKADRWMDLFDRFSPIEEIPEKEWDKLLKSRPFVDGEGLYYVDKIALFVNDWLSSIPADLKLATSQGAQADEGLSEFVRMHNQVTAFERDHLPSLRNASRRFVSCVHKMKPVAVKSWRQILDSENGDDDPGRAKKPSWKALEAFSGFQEIYEDDQGVALTNLTEPLVMVEYAVIDAFEKQLSDEFSERWRQITRSVTARSYSKQFPFALLSKVPDDADEISYQEMFELVDKLEKLSGAFGIELKSSEESQEIDERTEDLLSGIINSNRRAFLKRSLRFKDFLLGNEKKGPPEVSVVLLPGQIGRHYHWIRIRLGDGSFYDLNVYGEKPVKIRLRPEIGIVKLQGLSVDKSVLAERAIGTGDFALLKMPYVGMKNIDGKRKQWQVRSEIPASDDSMQSVNFTLVFSFDQKLPALPGWSS